MGIRKLINRRNISILFVAAMLIWVVRYISLNLNDFKDIKLLDWHDIIILFIFVLLGIFIRGLFNKVLLQSFDLELKFKHWFGVTVITALGNYIFPFGGVGLRATYLKKFHSFSYTFFVSTLMALYVIQFFIYSLVGLACLLFLYFKAGSLHSGLFVFFLLIIILCAVFIAFSSERPAHKNKLLNYISKAVNGWNRLKKDRILLLKLFNLLVARLIVSSLILYFAFLAFDYRIGIPEVVLTTCLVIFSTLLRITPGSLGIQEGAFVICSELFGLSIAQGLLVAGLVRVVDVIVIFTLGPLFSYLLINERVEGKSL